MSRFLFVSSMSSHPWGGSEELWAGAAYELSKAGHEVSASVQKWPQTHSKIKHLQSAGVLLNERRTSVFQSTLWTSRWQRAKHVWGRAIAKHYPLTESPAGFDKHVRRFKPDLVCVSNWGYRDALPWMWFLHREKIPFVSVVQTNAEYLWPTDKQLVKLSQVYQSAEAVFCVSKANLELLQNQLAMRLPQARVMWNPYQVDRQNPPEWPSQSQTWKIACVGRLEPNAKGQDLLFQVLAQPAWRNRNVKVSMFGGGISAQGVHQLAKLYELEDTLEFRGHVADVRQIWEEHHALVLPSRMEGLPLALVEALMCGRPAIVTNIAGNPEVVEDGINGFVADAPHVRSLSNAMERAWEARDEWKAMGETARAKILKQVPENPCKELAEALLQITSKSALRSVQ